MEELPMLTGLPPVLPEQPALLLLGSMPGVRSLTEAQYYAHPQNHFWRLVFAVLEEPCPETYPARINRLQARGIALWDSIYSCRRKGSLDKDIADATPNDIPALLEQYPSIRAIAFNGTAAQRAHNAHFIRRPGVEYLLLPSSSPVPRRTIRTMEDKLPYWLALRQYLDKQAGMVGGAGSV